MKIVSNKELAEGISARLFDLDNPEGANLNAIKTYFSGAGKLLSSVRAETDSYDRMGKPYRAHIQDFFGIEQHGDETGATNE